MYNQSDSVPRADISTVLMEAVGQEKQFIAQQVFPVFPSATEIGRYPKFKIASGELLKAQGATKRSVTGSYVEVDRKFTWDSYQTEEYGAEERIDDAVARRMQNFFDAEMVTAKLLMNELMLDYEIQAAAALYNTNATTAAYNPGFVQNNASTAWLTANLPTMDVPADVNTVIQNMTLAGEEPEVMVISLQLWNLIRRSTKLQTWVYGFLNVSQGGSQITPQMFAQCFGLRDIIIAKKSVDVSPKGTPDGSASLQPVWSNAYCAFAKLGAGDFLNGGVGRTIIWDADAPGGLFTSESYRDEPRRSNKVRVRSNRVIKAINPLSCQLIVTGFTS